MAGLEQAKAFVTEFIGRQREAFAARARAIWDLPELGCEEVKASRRVADLLREHGFEVEMGVAGMPSAFVARAGQGAPVIAFSCEYDVLHGLSQQRPDLAS